MPRKRVRTSQRQEWSIYPLDPTVFQEHDFALADVTDVMGDALKEIAPSGTSTTPQKACQLGEPPIEDNVSSTFQEVLDLVSGPSRTSPTLPCASKDVPEPVIKNLNLTPSPTPTLTTPFDISPLPKAPVSTQNRRGGKKGKCAILTSSPYKKDLEESINLSSKPKRKAPVKSSSKLPAKKRTLQAQPSPTDDTCLYCSMTYSQSVGEGWIQCQQCKLWAHDSCAGIDENDDEFICELCED